MSVKTRFILSFVVIVFAVLGLSIFVYNSIETTTKGFASYREMARDAVLASRVQANMLMLRMNAKDYMLTKSQKDINEFEHYYKITTKFVNKALVEIQKPSRAPKVKEIANELVSYKTYFYKMVDYYKQRDKIVYENLDTNGKKIEQLLTSVMNSAYKDGDKSSALDVSRAIRTLLLARLYTSKFLISNSDKAMNRVSMEFASLDGLLKKTKKGLENKTRRDKLSQAIKLIVIYEKGVHEISKIIKNRNDIIKNKLNKIGPKIAKLAEEVKLSVKKDQDTIGPRVAAQNESIKTVLIAASVFVLLFIVAIIFFVILKPLNRLNKLSKDLDAAQNDLTIKYNDEGSDEIAAIAKSINHFIENVRSIILSVGETSTENSSISHELSSTSISVGNKVEESVKIINDATDHASRIQDEINVAVLKSQSSKQDIIQASNTLEEAKEDILTLASKVQVNAQTESELSLSMDELSKDAEEIKTVLVVIADIADQTNLLALNAAIEAARAGEHGRGFAVVADEVRKLAERTQKSLAEINATINVVVQSITEASSRMNINSTEIQKLALTADDVERKINDAVETVNKAVLASEETVHDFEENKKGVDFIASKVKEVNVISSDNARSVEEIVSAAEHLNTMTDLLNEKISIFKVN